MAKEPKQEPEEEFEDAFEEEDLSLSPENSEGDSEDLFDDEEFEEFEDFEEFEGFEEEEQIQESPLPSTSSQAPLAVHQQQDHPQESIQETVPQGPKLDPQHTGEKVSVDELPMTLVVEAGRLTMNVKQLMDLAPGNVLDLHIIPENGVDLAIGGKNIGKGELLKIGETLGIRIIEIY